jgi:hypothetical protein
MDGDTFKWYNFPLGGFHLLYSYKWDNKNKKFTPVNTEDDVPTWILQNNTLKMENPKNDFEDLVLDGDIPPPLILAIAMHSWQWKREGELTETLSGTEN